MEQIPFYGDERQVASCIYCGSETTSRDHVPCRVLLDKPYPANLPRVPACQNCNGGASLDEEYVACLIECAVAGSTALDAMRRPKVRRILEQKPLLVAKLSQAQHTSKSGASVQVEQDRVRNVMLKLARGQVCHELNELERDEPQRFMVRPLCGMDPRERYAFETGPQQSVWPEVGSRAMFRMVESETPAPWLIVQPERYRYMTWAGGGVLVRIVAGDYLACEAFWE